jgi:hypothetical protein
MTFKKFTFNKNPRRIKRDAGGRNNNTKPLKEYINKWDKEQQEWARSQRNKDNKPDRYT